MVFQEEMEAEDFSDDASAISVDSEISSFPVVSLELALLTRVPSPAPLNSVAELAKKGYFSIVAPEIVDALFVLYDIPKSASLQTVITYSRIQWHLATLATKPAVYDTRWDQIDLANGVWRPSNTESSRKNKKEYPLSNAMYRMLQRQSKLQLVNALVFPLFAKKDGVVSRRLDKLYTSLLKDFNAQRGLTGENAIDGTIIEKSLRAIQKHHNNQVSLEEILSYFVVKVDIFNEEQPTDEEIKKELEYFLKFGLSKRMQEKDKLIDAFIKGLYELKSINQLRALWFLYHLQAKGRISKLSWDDINLSDSNLELTLPISKILLWAYTKSKELTPYCSNLIFLDKMFLDLLFRRTR